ncbi:MAG: methyltransferase domain-containing protein [Mycobacteriaceae bacterium]
MSKLPLEERPSTQLPGHWLLARLGKKVLRPGGKTMTAQLLAATNIRAAVVLEMAPGLGRTARDILAYQPQTYYGVEADETAVALSAKAIGASGTVTQGTASATGHNPDSIDVVIGEAMLTMQSERDKSAIVSEAFRILRTGGSYAIHELALTPNELNNNVKDEIKKSLARSIRVNARPLTSAEWTALLEQQGFIVDSINYAPMALLQPQRIIADEGLLGALKFISNVLRDSDSRKRVLHMRSVFRKYRAHLEAIAIVARKP